MAISNIISLNQLRGDIIIVNIQEEEKEIDGKSTYLADLSYQSNMDERYQDKQIEGVQIQKPRVLQQMRQLSKIQQNFKKIWAYTQLKRLGYKNEMKTYFKDIDDNQFSKEELVTLVIQKINDEIVYLDKSQIINQEAEQEIPDEIIKAKTKFLPKFIVSQSIYSALSYRDQHCYMIPRPIQSISSMNSQSEKGEEYEFDLQQELKEEDRKRVHFQPRLFEFRGSKKKQSVTTTNKKENIFKNDIHEENSQQEQEEEEKNSQQKFQKIYNFDFQNQKYKQIYSNKPNMEIQNLQIQGENQFHSIQSNSSIASNQLECPICLSSVSEDQWILNSTCHHSACKECITQYLQNQIDTSIIKIKCWQDGCNGFLSEKTIVEFLNEVYQKKYSKFKIRAMVRENADLRFCVATDCENYVKMVPGQQLCNCECGFQFCGRCNQPWHSGKSCEEVMDQELKLYSQNNFVQNCPNCKSRTEKNDGCNHITCAICKHEWCWLCTCKYEKNHFNKWNLSGCPGYYAEKRLWPLNRIKRYRIMKRLKLFFLVLGLMVFGILILYLKVVYRSNKLNKEKSFSVCNTIWVNKTLKFAQMIFFFIFSLILGIFQLIFLFQQKLKQCISNRSRGNAINNHVFRIPGPRIDFNRGRIERPLDQDIEIIGDDGAIQIQVNGDDGIVEIPLSDD